MAGNPPAPDRDPGDPAEPLIDPERNERTAQANALRVVLAAGLGLATVIMMVLLAVFVSADGPRLWFFIVACVPAVCVIYVLPTEWRTRLGAPTATFVAVASALSIFLVSPSPQSPASAKTLDVSKMANSILIGPFDQSLPSGVAADNPRKGGTRDANAAQATVVVWIDLVSTGYGRGGEGAGADLALSQIEVYPSDEVARKRAVNQFEWRSGIEEAQRVGSPAPEIYGEVVEMWCFTEGRGQNARIVCGGLRGHAYVET